MKSFNHYITERPAKLSATFPYKGAEWKDFRGLENPTEKEIIALMKKSKQKELRFVVDGKGKMWAWDTNDALHDAVIFAQTGEKYDGDYAKGVIIFFDVNSDKVYHKSGNLKVILHNSFSAGSKFVFKNKTMKEFAKRINAKGDERVLWIDA
jgi:hypothetical protein